MGRAHLWSFSRMTGFGEVGPACGIKEDTFSTLCRSREGRKPFFLFGWEDSGLGKVRFTPFLVFDAAAWGGWLPEAAEVVVVAVAVAVVVVVVVEGESFFPFGAMVMSDFFCAIWGKEEGRGGKRMRRAGGRRINNGISTPHTGPAQSRRVPPVVFCDDIESLMV